MKTSTIEPAAAEQILAMAFGEYAWGSRSAQDGILRLDLGSPHLCVHEPSARAANFAGAARTALERRVVVPTGRWHLFVENGLWRVTTMGMACDRTDAEEDRPPKRARVAKCLSLLDGQKLMAARQIGAAGEWRFDFDLGAELSIRPDAAADPSLAEDVWTFFLEGGSSLSYLSDRTFVLEEAVPT